MTAMRRLLSQEGAVRTLGVTWCDLNKGEEFRV